MGLSDEQQGGEEEEEEEDEAAMEKEMDVKKEDEEEVEEKVGVGVLDEADILDPNPDIRALFCHYNQLYFEDKLQACTVDWSTSRMTLCAGICKFNPMGGCAIRLSEPLLKYRSTAELKETLLHEMIHAYLWLTNKNKDHDDHGPCFQKLMNGINCSTVLDYQRPEGGYHIGIYHNFKSEVENYRRHHWKCIRCGDFIRRSVNRPPSRSDCFWKPNGNGPCQLDHCHWHSHEKICGGEYEKVAEPEGYIDRRRKLGLPGKQGAKSIRQPLGNQVSKVTGKKSDSLNKADQEESNVQTSKPTALDKFVKKGFHSIEETVHAMQGNSSDSSSEEIRGRKRKKRTNGDMSERVLVEESCGNQLGDDCTVIIGWKGWCGFEGREDEESVKALNNKRSKRRMLEKVIQIQSACKVEFHLDLSNKAVAEQGGYITELACTKGNSMMSISKESLKDARGLQDEEDTERQIFVPHPRETTVLVDPGGLEMKTADPSVVCCCLETFTIAPTQDAYHASMLVRCPTIESGAHDKEIKDVRMGSSPVDAAQPDYEMPDEQIQDLSEVDMHDDVTGDNKAFGVNRMLHRRANKQPRERGTQSDAPAVEGPFVNCPLCGMSFNGDYEDAAFNARVNQHIDTCFQI